MPRRLTTAKLWVVSAAGTDGSQDEVSAPAASMSVYPAALLQPPTRSSAKRMRGASDIHTLQVGNRDGQAVRRRRSRRP